MSENQNTSLPERRFKHIMTLQHFCHVFTKIVRNPSSCATLGKQLNHSFDDLNGVAPLLPLYVVHLPLPHPHLLLLIQVESKPCCKMFPVSAPCLLKVPASAPSKLVANKE